MNKKKYKRVLIVNVAAVDNVHTFASQTAEELYSQGEFRFVEQSKFCYFTAEPTCFSLDKILIGIECESVYSNYYEGMIAIDVQALESSAGETFVESFLTKLARLNERAAFLFFCMPGGRIANAISRHFARTDTISSISKNGGEYNEEIRRV